MNYRKYYDILKENLLYCFNDENAKLYVLTFLYTHYDDLILYHSTLGRWLRNQGMWEEYNSDINVMCPDTLSNLIIQDIHRDFQYLIRGDRLVK